MGCTMSKSAVEPCTVTIKLSGCSILARGCSSPVQLADGEHLEGNPRTESDHVVSLTSSTYGSLRLDSVPNVGEEHARARSGSMGNVASVNASGRSGNTEDVKPVKGTNCKRVETINMWELMDGVEEDKAALRVLRGLIGKSKVSESDSGKRSPRVYHTLEDVDTVLDVRRSLTPDYRFIRGSSLDSVTDRNTGIHSPVTGRKTGIHSPMLQKRRSQAMQISQEVIEELDDLRRRNLSRSQELNFAGRRNLSQSQEFNSRGRGSVSRSQEFYSRARRNLSQSQDLDSTRRIKLTRNQEPDFRRIRNLSRSQEFVRPYLAEPKEAYATRHSSDTLRTAQMKDERRVPLSKPDVVLRSPMLRGLSGPERFVSSNSTSIERRSKPLLQGQVQPAADWKTTLPRAAGSTKVGLNMNSPERRSGKVLEPRVASAVAALSRLGEQRAASMARYETERKVEGFQDQSSNLTEANYYTVSKAPAYTSVATFEENTQLIVPQDHDQDGRRKSALKKQSDRSSCVSTTAPSGQKGQSAAMISSTSEALFQGKTFEKSPRTQDMYSQGEPESLLDDPISLDYELVTKAEVAEAVLRSGSLPAEQPRQRNATFKSMRDTNTNKNASWSLGLECRDSPPLDVELLASFEEALEMFTADDWCTVRIGDNDDLAVTSGSTSDGDSPSWLRESLDDLNCPAGDTILNKFEILENHVEKPHPKKIASSKIAPMLQVEELKITKSNPLENFKKKCPPGGEARCVLYITSLRGIRKTFEDCSHTRRILQYSSVQIDERDIAMHGEFRQEVNDLVGRAAPVPRLFIRGRYIGGAEEVAHLFEEGTLSALLEDLPRQVSHAVCDGCGGVRFVPCATCCGSCKVVTEEGAVACCQECNENGLCRCPLCL